MSHSQNPKTKKVLITGASSDIGLECAKIFVKNGFFMVGTTTI